MSPLGGNGSHWDGCWDSHFDCAQKRIAALESQLAALKEPPTDGDAAYWHTAWKVIEAELQAKTVEVEWWRKRYGYGVVFKDSEDFKRHIEVNGGFCLVCQQWTDRPHVHFDAGRIPHPSQGGGE